MTTSLRRWSLVALLLAGCRSPAGEAPVPDDASPLVLVEQGDAAEPPLLPICFAEVFGPGAAFDAGKGATEQAGIEQHVAWLQRHFDAGRLVMAGPFLDDSGGMVLWLAADLAEARALADGDPLVRSGVFAVVSVRPWMVALR